jgi:hypothetical protein
VTFVTIKSSSSSPPSPDLGTYLALLSGEFSLEPEKRLSKKFLRMEPRLVAAADRSIRIGGSEEDLGRQSAQMSQIRVET